MNCFFCNFYLYFNNSYEFKIVVTISKAIRNKEFQKTQIGIDFIGPLEKFTNNRFFGQIFDLNKNDFSNMGWSFLM